jgi:hypothetical protein
MQWCLWLAFCWFTESITNSYWGKTVEFEDESDAESGVVFAKACCCVFRTALPLVVQ